MCDTISRAGKHVDDDVSARLGEASAGYPFMVQLVGYYTWQSAARRDSEAIEMQDADRGIARARESFDSMVIAPALRRLPARQLNYLAAMAHCASRPASTGEASELMGLSSRETSSYRKRLIDAGIIEKCGYGKVDFTIPYMREYLLAHIDDVA